MLRDRNTRDDMCWDTLLGRTAIVEADNDDEDWQLRRTPASLSWLESPACRFRLCRLDAELWVLAQIRVESATGLHPLD